MLPLWKGRAPRCILGVFVCLLALSAARPSSSPVPAAENATTPSSVGARDEKVSQPAIGESIKMVANQLLQESSKTPPPTTNDGGIVEDIRTPPKMKNQQTKIKPVVVKPSPYTAKPQVVENSNAGVAVPIVEVPILKAQVKKEAAVVSSTTTSEGLSTWILLSEGSTTSIPKFTTTSSVVSSSNPKVETKPTSKPKPKPTTPKLTRQTTTVAPKPIFNRKPVAIVSSNKSDLIASGSAVNENVMNKIKASVLANVQKNKAAQNKTSTTQASPSTPLAVSATTQIITETPKPVTEAPKKPTIIIAPKLEKVEISTKKTKLSNKKKHENEVEKKKEHIEIEVVSSDASLESKEAEIELEVSTPAPSSTKKPKRKTSTKKKKNKNRRRKPVEKPSKQESANEAESKISPANNTKAVQKTPAKEKPITTQLYNYFSREVMPSVGVGLVSLAGIVGLASYFLYPFSNVVRRAYDVNERKDDIYQQSGELYATADGGQTEEEMLGTFFPDVSESNKKINPYSKQTPFHYPQKKVQEQNIRYRNVAYSSDQNSFIPSNRVGQQSVEPTKGAVYSEPIQGAAYSEPIQGAAYSEPIQGAAYPEPMQGAAYSEPIHYDTHVNTQTEEYPSYSQMQPVYNPVQENSDTTYVTDSVQASYMTQDRAEEPTYGQNYQYGQHEFDYSKQVEHEAPVAEALHMGPGDVIEQQRETGYTVAPVEADDIKHTFVVGNVPKELIQAVTPVTVPEHGPRGFRLKRDVEVETKKGDQELSNEISPPIHLTEERAKTEKRKKVPENQTDKKMANIVKSAIHLTEKPESSNDVNTISVIEETTTKRPIIELKEQTNNNEENMIVVVEVVTKAVENGESESDPLPTSTIVLTESTTSGLGIVEVSTGKDNTPSTTYKYDEQTYPEEEYPDTYPPVHEEQKPFTVFGLLRNLIDFKVRLGMSILQTTSETIARYLRGVEHNFSNAAKASANVHHHYHHHHKK